MSKSSVPSYKQILRQHLLEKKRRFGRGFSYQKMADACRIQKTYLSKVMHSESVHLNPDQLYSACRYLGFAQEETDRMLLVLEYERSENADRKARLLGRIEAWQKLHELSEEHLAVKEVHRGTEDLSGYYLDPDAQLVHIFLTVPRFRGQVDGVRRALGLSRARFSAILSLLAASGIVREQADGTLEVVRQDLHLSADSPWIGAYKALLRLRAIEAARQSPSDKNYGFSVIFSATREVRAAIQARYFAFLGEVEAMVKDAPAEDVFQLGFDLIQWS